MLSRLSTIKTWRPHTAAFVFAVWFVTAGLTLILRAIRLYHRGAIRQFVIGIDVYKSDLFFLLAFLLLGIFGLYLLRERRRARIVFLGLLVLAGLVTSAIEAIAFRFFVATGSTIDFGLIAYSVENLDDAWEVIRSEVPNWMFVLLGAIVLVYCTVPFLFSRFWANRVYVEREAPRRGSPFVASSAVGVMCAALAFAPPIKEPARAFAKNATLHVLTTAWGSVFRSGDTGETAEFNTTLAKLSGDSDWNVVFIVLESTRATATSVHNPELDTTPFLKSLTENSLWLDRAYAIVPHTSKALVGILCGIPPRLHMPITEASRNGVPGRCLARLLGDKGYQSAFFQSATQRFESRKQLVKNMGYDAFFPDEKMDGKGFERVNYFGKEDDIMVEPSRKWLKENKAKGPLFMTYLTLTPHHNYLAPRRYGRHAYSKKDEFNRYLNTIHYVDNFTKNIVEMFKEEGLYDKTIFVVVGDHGEGFGEHGRRQHDNVIWQEGIRVPLIIHQPNRFEGGKKIEFSGNQLDIVPTVITLAGMEAKQANFPGADLTTLETERTLFAHCWYERRCMASIRGDEKFIYHFDQREDEFYNLAEDPDEKENRVDTMADYQARRDELITWRLSVNNVYSKHYRDRVSNYVSTARPSVKNNVDAMFGDYVRVVGYSLDRKMPIKAGSNVRVTTVYEVLKEVPSGYKLFMHGRGDGVKMSNFDHVAADGFYSIEDWQKGEFITDTYSVRVPKKAKGTYTIQIGIYHPKEGRIELADGKNTFDLVEMEIAQPAPKK